MKQLVVVGMLVVAPAVIAGRAGAQGSEKGPGNPTILDAVRTLQDSVNTLQTTVNNTQTTLTNLGNAVSNLQSSVTATASKVIQFNVTAAKRFTCTSDHDFLIYINVVEAPGNITFLEVDGGFGVGAGSGHSVTVIKLFVLGGAAGHTAGLRFEDSSFKPTDGQAYITLQTTAGATANCSAS